MTVDYCVRWMIARTTIGLLPIVATVVVAALVARLPARLWLGLGVALVVAIPVFLAGRVFSLILWNGVSPAPGICEF